VIDSDTLQAHEIILLSELSQIFVTLCRSSADNSLLLLIIIIIIIVIMCGYSTDEGSLVGHCCFYTSQISLLLILLKQQAQLANDEALDYSMMNDSDILHIVAA